MGLSLLVIVNVLPNIVGSGIDKALLKSSNVWNSTNAKPFDFPDFLSTTSFTCFMSKSLKKSLMSCSEALKLSPFKKITFKAFKTWS